jgi:serpin B
MKKGLLIFVLLSCTNFLFAQQIVESNNKFSFDAYQKIKKNENFIFSPFSISSAIAMTYAGSKNNTLTEISEVFYFNKNLNNFHKDFKNLSEFKSNKNSKVQFYSANSIWIDKDLKLEDTYLTINKKFYSGIAYLQDFQNFPEKSRVKINTWVEKNTNNKITDLLKSSDIDISTRLVLVNALYFNGSWDKQFKKEENTIEKFQIGKRIFEDKTFMNATINSSYYEDKLAEIIDIYYSNAKYSLMIIIPKSYRKMKKFEKSLSFEYYMQLEKMKKMKRVNLSIPKFEIETDLNLNETLQRMGIKDAFNSSADFSGITTQEKLYISNVVHKAKITVTENGTEAAAATAVVMRKTSFIADQVDLKIDKPFIYILRNTENNCIYFMGKIVNP